MSAASYSTVRNTAETVVNTLHSETWGQEKKGTNGKSLTWHSRENEGERKVS